MRAFLFALFSLALVIGCAGVRSPTLAPADGKGPVSSSQLSGSPTSANFDVNASSSQSQPVRVTDIGTAGLTTVTPPYLAPLRGPVAAFPGAQGGGAGSVGGRGGAGCEGPNVHYNRPDRFSRV